MVNHGPNMLKMVHNVDLTGYRGFMIDKMDIHCVLYVYDDFSLKFVKIPQYDRFPYCGNRHFWLKKWTYRDVKFIKTSKKLN